MGKGYIILFPIMNRLKQGVELIFNYWKYMFTKNIVYCIIYLDI